MHTDEHGGTKDGRPTAAERSIENNGEGFICDDIAQQEGDQNPVFTLFQQSQHLGGVCLLSALARVSNDL